MSENMDASARTINEGLLQLRGLLEKPVAISALELGKNAAAAHEFDVLERLHKSMLQYIERNGSLFYVGILGHFSAGKSSTINSLLATWGTQDERKVDLNPTDTTITLLTQEKNAPSLLGVIREGHVTIRLETFDSPVLEEVVLVDTPGTGDPQFIEEVARDFLPICDIILFVFSAASPLDKSDVPLLAELHKRLEFIPIHFVVTRTDELRIDMNASLSESNLDTKKADLFLSAVVTRVNDLLKPQVYMKSSFTLIDNKSSFRTDDLRQLLHQRCNSSNPQAHVAMHLNKLHYYRSSAINLKVFFSEILEIKLTELTKIVEAAGRNIERYQQLVQISNSNLTRSWSEHSNKIRTSAGRSVDAVKAAASFPQTLAAFRGVSAKRTLLIQELARSARFHSTSLESTLRASVIGLLQQHSYALHKVIADVPLDELSADQHAGLGAPIILAPGLAELQSTASLYREGFELREAEAEALREAAAEIRKVISILNDETSRFEIHKYGRKSY